MALTTLNLTNAQDIVSSDSDDIDYIPDSHDDDDDDGDESMTSGEGSNYSDLDPPRSSGPGSDTDDPLEDRDANDEPTSKASHNNQLFDPPWETMQIIVLNGYHQLGLPVEIVLKEVFGPESVLFSLFECVFNSLDYDTRVGLSNAWAALYPGTPQDADDAVYLLSVEGMTYRYILDAGLLDHILVAANVGVHLTRNDLLQGCMAQVMRWYFESNFSPDVRAHIPAYLTTQDAECHHDAEPHKSCVKKLRFIRENFTGRHGGIRRWPARGYIACVKREITDPSADYYLGGPDNILQPIKVKIKIEKKPRRWVMESGTSNITPGARVQVPGWGPNSVPVFGRVLCLTTKAESNSICRILVVNERTGGVCSVPVWDGIHGVSTTANNVFLAPMDEESDHLVMIDAFSLMRQAAAIEDITFANVYDADSELWVGLNDALSWDINVMPQYYTEIPGALAAFEDARHLPTW